MMILQLFPSLARFLVPNSNNTENMCEICSFFFLQYI